LDSTSPRNQAEAETDYVSRVIQFIDDRIGGFSISHVSGRFRVGPILSRKDSGEKLANDEPYLIDETTAVVRFIVPCKSSESKHTADFVLSDPPEGQPDEVRAEIQQIRGIFFEIFVEGLVHTIRGEKLIWLLETSRMGQRLYELCLSSRGPNNNTDPSEVAVAEDSE
jgi:hypothetical protein